MFLKMMVALPSYVYATDPDSIYVNLFIGSKAIMEANGTRVELRQTTRYPWEGAVRIAVDPAQPASFPIMLRIPPWTTGETVKVNGQTIPTDQRVRGYLRIARKWNPNDVIELNFPMAVRQVYANPLVQATLGRSVILRGPLVYCVESVGNPPVRALQLPHETEFATRLEEGMLGGTVVVAAKGSSGSTEAQALYSTQPQAYSAQAATIEALPYYANANRGPVDMAVWLPLTT